MAAVAEAPTLCRLNLSKNRESLFLSTVVTKREEANVLHTQDGITIVFRGFMNTSRSSQNGVPLEVCQHFLVGFPHDWNKYAPHSYGDSSASSVDNMECENSNTAGLNMCNSEKGISVQREGNGGYLIGTDPSEKDTVKPPSSTKKVKPIRQKIVLDASNSFSRMVTRSISKKMLHNAKKT
ncbi:unnamed protein product [Sphenostylis stenocarpa]|uniref:SANTA domain-containing protein n=1 Tax=Sphenostylis stenocarpa TaxID=92480 RepID=A0AA86W6P1_9FABA|nr:unnamed protein product [Sphenostylis stenocarpa]